MANHNPGARAFLFIVLGGIVIGFVIAAFLLGGNESETAVEMEKPAAAQPAEAPAAAADDTAMSDDEGMSDEEMADDMSPPDAMPDDAMPDDAMSDDLSPPDAMPDDAMPDEAPDATTPAENPEEPVSEEPAPARNP